MGGPDLVSQETAGLKLQPEGAWVVLGFSRAAPFWRLRRYFEMPVESSVSVALAVGDTEAQFNEHVRLVFDRLGMCSVLAILQR